MAKLWYTHWAENRNEALPVGNGRIGAMIYGNPYRDTMSLNEETLWSGAPYGTEPSYDPEKIAYARQLLQEKKYFEAETYLNENLMEGVRSQTYLPLGRLHFEVNHNHLINVESYRRELDLQTAVLSSETKFLCRQNSLDDGQTVVTHKKAYFSSLADDVFVMHFESDRPITGYLSLDLQLSGNVSYQGDCLYATGRCPTRYNEYNKENVLMEEAEKESIPYTLQAKFITDGTLYGEGRSIAVRGATQTTVVVSIATGFNGYNRQPISQGKDHRAICREKLEKALLYSYEALKSRHISAYREQFDRSQILLEGADGSHLPTDQRLKRICQGEPDITFAGLLFDYGKYLMISSSQPGGQATNLQGIWNEEAVAPWNSNYTLNINTQMNYWAAEIMDLPECHMPLMTLTKELSQRGNPYGLPGWCAEHNTDLWRFHRMATRYAMYGLWDMGGLWLARHIYDHYRYTKDAAFLLEYLPVLRGVYDFLEARLTADAQGYLVLSPSTSPETTYLYDGQVCSVTANAAMDVQMIADYLQYMELLDPEEGHRYRSMAAQLRPQAISGDGRLLEYGEDLPETPDAHQHLSHIYGIYPGNSIQKGTALYDAARKALDSRMEKGGGNNGWANIWAGLCYARFGDGEKAYERILHMAKHTLYPNLLNICPPFQIDGNFGVCALICEMLLQGNSDAPELLPAIPKAWKSGSVQGLKLPGGRSVSFRWKDGKIIP